MLTALQSAGLFVPAPCGGKSRCGKCAIKIAGGDLPPSSADVSFFSPSELESGWRLACAAFPSAALSVEVPEAPPAEFSTAAAFTLNGIDLSGGPPGGANRPGYGIAIDIGTTTLGLALLCRNTGSVAAYRAELNRQRMYGGDVVSRIQAANDGELELLRRCICEQTGATIAALCAGAGVAVGEVKQIAVAGNTVMLHLLQGLSCRGLGTAPFTPVTLDMLVTDSRELLENFAPADLDCDAVVLPGIAAYVGADVSSGIFFTDLHRDKSTSMLLDIGTNGEMALACGGKIYCAATAAGPAFEGGNIRWGMGSVPGAVAQAQFRGGGFDLKTIGDRPPLGICGSGVVDIVYQGLKNELIQPSGRFSEKVPPEGIFLAKAPDGRDIMFCQKDVRELQLAKSAIRTGLDFLLAQAGRRVNDIDHLYIAGGLGFNLNMESAAGIGLIPQALLPKVKLVGNSALGGAARFLLESGASAGTAEETLRNIAKQAVEVRLPGNALFNERFTENLELSAH